jgi:hypothetical protein
MLAASSITCIQNELGSVTDAAAQRHDGGVHGRARLCICNPNYKKITYNQLHDSHMRWCSALQSPTQHPYYTAAQCVRTQSLHEASLFCCMRHKGLRLSSGAMHAASCKPSWRMQQTTMPRVGHGTPSKTMTDHNRSRHYNVNQPPPWRPNPCSWPHALDPLHALMQA